MTAKKSSAKKPELQNEQNHKIDPSLLMLSVPVDSLVPLENNPRKGDVEAIMASYDEFGQVKPIVIRPNDDGTATVIAGNHQTEAARRLGWTHIAAVPMNTDDKRALAFALAENRTMELGHNDPILLHDAIVSVFDDYSETFEALGWDDFQLAEIDDRATYLTESQSSPSGYIPPVLVAQPGEVPPPVAPTQPQPNVESVRIEAPPSVNSREAVTLGSPSVGAAGTKAVVQYMLVFDDAEQQRQWYDFLRWLRSDPGTDGDTTAEKLLNFVSAHGGP
jgi:hypothetical protein